MSGINRLLKHCYILLFSILCLTTYSQTPYVVSGIDTICATSNGYDIPRTSPISLIVKNSRFSTAFSSQYILLAGHDEHYPAYENNVDNAIITGNVFKYTGNDAGSGLHTIMAGNNKNYHIKFNHFIWTAYATVYEQYPTTGAYTSGGHSYNVHNNIKNIRLGGVNGLRIYNNTFYTSRSYTDALIFLMDNVSDNSPTTNIKIKNNIFYRKRGTSILQINADCLAGLECDYNVYYCKAGNPTFFIDGQGTKTWEQWRALGYDAHSVVRDPYFIDTISFVPSQPIYIGTNLGEEFGYGLAPETQWKVGAHPDTVQQGNSWQAGARIYNSNILVPELMQSVIEESAPARLVLIYNVALVNVVPDISSFNVYVNSAPRTIKLVEVSGSNVSLTLSSAVCVGDEVSVSYIAPDTNPLQTAAGGRAANLTNQPVENNSQLSKDFPLTAKLNPNPNSGHFIIEVSCPPTSEEYDIRILNLLGKIIFQKTYAQEAYRNDLDLTYLESGIYLTYISIGKLIIGTIRFIKI